LRKRKKGALPPLEKAAAKRDLSGPSRATIAALGLGILALLAYANSFDAGLTLDNATLVLKDSRIREVTGANISGILQHTYYWPSGEAGIYRPFTTLTFLFNYAVLGNGDRPAGYHWINLLLHMGNVLLVYRLASRCVRGLWTAFFIAAIWAVHPLLTEAVTNIAGRADLLAAMAVLSGLLMYVKSTETSGPPRMFWLAGLMGVTAVGVFSKESAVCIVGVLAAYEIFRGKTPGRGKALLIAYLAILPPIAAMLYERSVVLAASLPAEFPFVDNPIAGAGFWTGRLTAIKVVARYSWLVVWPAKLSADYSWPEIPLARGSIGDWAAWTAVLAIAAGIGLYSRRRRPALFFAVFAAVTFLPVSNLLFPTGTIMAERLLYLPSIGLIGLVVISISAAAERTGTFRYRPAVFCVVIAVCAIRTWSRNLDWSDDLTIATSSLSASPNSFKLHKQRASSLYESDPRHANIDEVAEEGDKSVRLLESLPDALNNRDAWRLAGGYHLLKGDLQQLPEEYRRARDLLLRAVAIDESYRAAYGLKVRNAKARNPAVPAAPAPDSDLYQFLAASYVRLGDTTQALRTTRQALALHPRMPGAYRQIAYTFSQYNRVDDAAVALIQGMILTSDPALENDLLDLYNGEVFARTCAVSRGTGARSIDYSCMRVREHFCAASAEAIKAWVEEERPDLARQQQDRYSREHRCPVQPPA
jgi:protein O-mannosyl-transferase